MAYSEKYKSFFKEKVPEIKNNVELWFDEDTKNVVQNIYEEGTKYDEKMWTSIYDKYKNNEAVLCALVESPIPVSLFVKIINDANFTNMPKLPKKCLCKDITVNLKSEEKVVSSISVNYINSTLQNIDKKNKECPINGSTLFSLFSHHNAIELRDSVLYKYIDYRNKDCQKIINALLEENEMSQFLTETEIAYLADNKTIDENIRNNLFDSECNVYIIKNQTPYMKNALYRILSDTIFEVDLSKNEQFRTATYAAKKLLEMIYNGNLANNMAIDFICRTKHNDCVPNITDPVIEAISEKLQTPDVARHLYTFNSEVVQTNLLSSSDIDAIMNKNMEEYVSGRLAQSDFVKNVYFIIKGSPIRESLYKRLLYTEISDIDETIASSAYTPKSILEEMRGGYQTKRKKQCTGRY